MKVLSRSLDESEMADVAKLMRIVPRQSLMTSLVEKHIATHDTIMLHRDCRFTRGSHFRRYKEIDKKYPSMKRYYIRMGKRGECKRYLTSCDITFLNGEPALFQYRTEDRPEGRA